MVFGITLHFTTDHDLDLFVDRVVPRVRGRLVEPPADETAESEGYKRLAVAVTSASAARDLCSHAFGFLTHLKGARIVFAWNGLDGVRQFGEIESGQSRDAELLSIRLGSAAKAALDGARDQEGDASG